MSRLGLLRLNTVAIALNVLAFVVDVLGVGVTDARHDTAGALLNLGWAVVAAIAIGYCVRWRMEIPND